MKRLIIGVLFALLAMPVFATDIWYAQGARMWVSSANSAFNFTEQIRLPFTSQSLCLSAINNIRTEALQQPDASGTTPAMKNPDPNYGSFRQLLAVQCIHINDTM